MNVHSNFIHNSHKLETIQMSSNWWIEEQIVLLNLYNGILLYKMEQLFVYAETWMILRSILQSERSQIQDTIYYNMILVNEILKEQNYNDTN